MDEILEWLQKTINQNAGESSHSGENGSTWHTSYKSSYSFEYKGAAVSLTWESQATLLLTSNDLADNGENDDSYHTVFTFSLRDLDPDRIRTQPEKGNPNILNVQLETTNLAKKIKVKQVWSTQCGGNFGRCKGKKGDVISTETEWLESSLTIPFDSALAVRVVDAFRDAVIQAGGKKSIKEIY